MGGKAIDAGYRQDKEFGCLQNEPGAYDVAFANGGTIDVVSVNADTGVVNPREKADRFDGGQDVLEKIIAPGHVPDADAALQLALPITAAASIAEEGGGKAMNVWADRKDGVPGYRVTLVENGKTRTEWVDSGGRRS